jgi:hypothetical protein
VHVDFLSAGLAVAEALRARSAIIALDGQLDLAGHVVPVHLQRGL